MKWFTSDLHFGHKRIIDYCHRPWNNLEEMANGLIANINSVVSKDDDLYILGDLSFYGTGRTSDLVRKINGNKVLVRGNHDSIGTVEKAIAVGLVDVIKSGVMDLGPYRVNISHYPYRGDSGPEDRYPERRLPDDGNWLLHGHVHETWRIKPEERMINVGVDVWNFMPISELDVIRLIEGAKNEGIN